MDSTLIARRLNSADFVEAVPNRLDTGRALIIVLDDASSDAFPVFPGIAS